MPPKSRGKIIRAKRSSVIDTPKLLDHNGSDVGFCLQRDMRVRHLRLAADAFAIIFDQDIRQGSLRDRSIIFTRCAM